MVLTLLALCTSESCNKLFLSLSGIVTVRVKYKCERREESLPKQQ